MNERLWKVAALLFGSGLCALVYQTVWLRELRLIFGASTAASAAVLAIFMGGLGLGGVLLGRRADRAAQPLALYGNLELLIAATTAVTPFLLVLARWLYVGLGGTVSLGLGLGTGLRLLLATLVLAGPTLLMGGTLPAAARAVETQEDVGRRALAVLYGVNALGAVTGAVLSTFFLLEIYGNRNTLWLACGLNALGGLLARVVARGKGGAPGAESAGASEAPLPVAAVPERVPGTPDLPGSRRAPETFVLTAAAGVGFAFFLMELVWYRLLNPLLGGSTFTFGLILAVALAGIGLGGAAYAALGRGRPATLAGFGLTCAAEAACLALPFALGDKVAVVAVLLHPLSAMGFGGLILDWTAMTTFVVFPAAFVAGVQFPLLISLLGTGREEVGRQVGLAYAWNTAGSIVGSLAGGFGALPVLGALNTWRLVVGALAVLAVLAVLLSARRERHLGRLAMACGALALSLGMMGASGPTAAWRHSPIGAGRVNFSQETSNRIEDWLHFQRRVTFWERDGLESSVAMMNLDGISFLINGKSDGNAVNDAATQVMAGMVGALLHPAPKRSLVVGLGTGSTAGWLAKAPGMERVDVVELEPSILDVARACHPVNQDVMENPRVRVLLGDAREVLLASSERYDIIFSEPSNPFRAGISSLFTRDFYHAVKGRMNEGGIFLQWLQAYEVDAATVRTVAGNLSAEMGAVEIWVADAQDLLLVASAQPQSHDAAQLRSRISQEPYHSALVHAWRVADLEGFFSHFIAAPKLSKALEQDEGTFVNTDDQPSVEFAFARNVGKTAAQQFPGQLRDFAWKVGAGRPDVRGEVDWDRVDQQALIAFLFGGQPPPGLVARPGNRQRLLILAEAFQGNFSAAFAQYQKSPFEPKGPFEVALLAEVQAERGSNDALALIDALRVYEPVAADVVQARLWLRQGKLPEAASALEAAFLRYRTEPWALSPVMGRGLKLAVGLAERQPALGVRMFHALEQPFAAYALEENRRRIEMTLAGAVDFQGLCATALSFMEPHIPWDKETLSYRVHCYQARGDARLFLAQSDLDAYLAREPEPLVPGGEEAPFH